MGWYLHNETRDLYYSIGSSLERIQYAFRFVFITLGWSFSDTLSIVNGNVDYAKVVNF